MTVYNIHMHAESIVNTIMTNGHSSLEEYTSHTLFGMVGKGYERVMCERWVGDWAKLQHIDPQALLAIATLLSRSPGLLNRGPEGCKPSVWSWFSRWHLISKTLTLTNWTSCRKGLYYCLTFTCFLWASHLYPTQPVYSQGYPLISSTGCNCYLHRCISYLTARPGRRSICYKSKGG